jgi:hypothetical protein
MAPRPNVAGTAELIAGGGLLHPRVLDVIVAEGDYCPTSNIAFGQEATWLYTHVYSRIHKK